MNFSQVAGINWNRRENILFKLLRVPIVILISGMWLHEVSRRIEYDDGRNDRMDPGRHFADRAADCPDCKAAALNDSHPCVGLSVKAVVGGQDGVLYIFP
jgi:hypothetical protein